MARGGGYEKKLAPTKTCPSLKKSRNNKNQNQNRESLGSETLW